MATASEIPLEMVAGESAEWTKNLSDFPASVWDAEYRLIGPTTLTVTGVPDGDAFDFVIAEPDSVALTAGVFDWQLFVDDTAGDIKVPQTGELTVLEDAGAATPAPEIAKSFARRMVEAIESVLLGRATSDVQEYTIAGRSLTKIPFMELSDIRKQFRAEVAREDAQEAVKRGATKRGKVLVRFP